jgi:hypothetical protein
MDSRAYSLAKDDPPRQQSEAPVARSLIGISELDSRIQEQIADYESIKHFHVVLWRDHPDATGYNWNARIERIQGNASDCSWWNVVPQMRERFNLV